MDLLLDLNQIGQTLLIVTYDERLATRCASRVIEVADGRISRERTLGGRSEQVPHTRASPGGCRLAGLPRGGYAPAGPDLRHRSRRARPLRLPRPVEPDLSEGWSVTPRQVTGMTVMSMALLALPAGCSASRWACSCTGS